MFRVRRRLLRAPLPEEVGSALSEVLGEEAGEGVAALVRRADRQQAGGRSAPALLFGRFQLDQRLADGKVHAALPVKQRALVEQWAGAICVDSTVFGIPHSSDRVLVIKIKTKGGMEEENSGVAAFGDGGSDKPGVSQAKKEECLAVTFLSSKKNETEVGKVFLSLRDDLCVTGEEKYESGALGSDGNIYCAPQKADQVLCISPKEMTASLVGEDLSEMDEHRFNGGAVAGRDGEMYFFHHKRHGFLRLNLPRPPKTDLVHDNADDSQRVGLINMRSKGFNSGENWWYSGVCANDGNLYFAPGGSNHVVQYCPRTSQDCAVLAIALSLSPELCALMVMLTICG